MPLEKHTLLNDFPQHHHTIRHLKMNNKHFSRLFEQYQALDSEVHQLEEENEPVADEYLDSLKMRRVWLKDQLFKWIQKTEQAL